LLSILVIKKLCQSHCPVQPGCSDFKIIGVFGSNDVINCLNLTTWLYFDCLTRCNCDRQSTFSLGANLVGSYCAYWVHQPCIVTKTKNLLPCIRNAEFAVGLDKCSCAQEEWPETVVDEIYFEDRTALAEESLPLTATSGQIGWRKSLKSFSVPKVMRSARPTSGMMEMLAEKLKWIGRETNSYNGRSCSASTNGTCKIKIMVCSSGRWMKESSSLYKSAGSCTNFWKWFLLAMSSIW